MIRPAKIYMTSRDAFILLYTGIPHPDSTVVVSSIGILVLFSSFSYIYHRKIYSCSIKEVPYAFLNFHILPCYQPYAEPPQLHIRQNLTIETTGSPPNPRSIGMNHKRANKLRRHRLERPHRVGSLWRTTTLISWQLRPTTILIEGIVRGTGERILASSGSVQMDPCQ